MQDIGGGALANKDLDDGEQHALKIAVHGQRKGGNGKAKKGYDALDGAPRHVAMHHAAHDVDAP